VSPDWSPVKSYGGYSRQSSSKGAAARAQSRAMKLVNGSPLHNIWRPQLWDFGCDCFAF
jgi:hypothetical protein